MGLAKKKKSYIKDVVSLPQTTIIDYKDYNLYQLFIIIWCGSVVELLTLLILL